MNRNIVAWSALGLSAAALVSSRGTTRPLPAAPQVTAEGQKAVKALSEAFEAVADFSKPSVVKIQIERPAGGLNLNLGRGPRRGPRLQPQPDAPNFDSDQMEELLRRFFNQGQGARPRPQQFGGGGGRTAGVGSGFVYDDRGHILTNNHVVDGGGKITVTFFDGVEATATVVGKDDQTDVAVIKVENTNYRPLPKGVSSKLKVGELVMAVGSPFGLSQSITTGVISATDRNDVGINDFESFIQTDAAINPGNSGGPLVNMDGQAVGINAAIMSGSRGNDGVGFTIPMDLAASVADNLIKNGKVQRSRVGLALEPLTPILAKQFGLDPKVKGVVVGQVLGGSPAEKAGLKGGDVITGYNGLPVANLPTFRMTVAFTESGRQTELAYFRDGTEHKTTIVPAPTDQVRFAREMNRGGEDGDDDDQAPAAKADIPKLELRGFGLEVQDLTPELVAQFGHAKDAKGLLVSNVKEGSPADAAGLEAGQLITRVVRDQKVAPLGSAQEFRTMAEKADEIALYVETTRGGHFVTLSKEKKD